jgi:phage antirepressor YoqD-like protein
MSSILKDSMYHFKLIDMNELSKVEKTMGSREIATLTGKLHKHVMRDIRNSEEPYIQVYGDESKFGLVTYQDEKGEYRPEYRLTKSQTLYLVSGYSPVIRAKIQKRWEFLESERRTAQIAIPTRKELALQVYEALEELEQAIDTLALQAPKVEFVEEVFEAPTLLSMGEAAKMLGIGRNILFARLRKRKVLMTGIRQNEPYQTFIERGYFEVKGAKVGSRSAVKVVPQTYVTTRGLAWIRLNIV